jgi:uncharacterized LabA/DUF88 family protein
MRAIFYIDGFNFYYLRTKMQPQYKWLNMKALADIIVNQKAIVTKVNYYTAAVSGKIDKEAPVRQQALFSAFRTIPEIEIVKGNFSYDKVWANIIKPPQTRPNGYSWADPLPDLIMVSKAEEKGSDVNLASHLVRDAFLDLFDVAYVITNDTDLVEAIRIVTQEADKKVCIVAPCRPLRTSHRPIPAPSLKKVASFVHYIDDAELEKSQFPNVIIRNGKKPVTKPSSWISS